MSTTRGCYIICLTAVLAWPLVLSGCQSMDMHQSERDPAATQPAGRDLDREGMQPTRSIMSLRESTIRIYDAPDGQLVVDERQTFDRQGLMRFLDRQDRRRLSSGIVYFVPQGDIKDKVAFLAIKTFCVRRNVDLYISEGSWSQQRRPLWMLDPAIHHDVTWIVQARP